VSNILLYSVEGEGLIFADKIRQESHELIAYVESKACKRVGDGIVFKTTEPDAIAAQADLILFDDNGCGEKADEYRKKGYTVWGGGTFVDKLEHDRLYGMKVFKEYGIPIPETFEVHDLAGVKAVLKSEFAKGEKVVIKLDGADAAGSAFSFVAKNPKSCEEQVEHWINDGALGKWSGIIQRFVEGIEVSVEAWWNGEEFSTHNITLEEKKLLAGNLGPSVGCAYNTIVRIDGGSRLFKTQLEPVAPLLKKSGYIGPIDTNSIVGEDGVAYALEWTPRMGYEATPTLAWGNNHGFANKILGILGLLDPIPEFGYKGRIWGAARVYVPPYPASLPDEKATREMYESCCGVPILDRDRVEEDFWLYDAMRDDEGKLVCAGTSGMIGVAFGAGDDPKEAAGAAYRVAEAINVPDKGYRALDGWKRHQDALATLRGMKLVRLYPGLP